MIFVKWKYGRLADVIMKGTIENEKKSELLDIKKTYIAPTSVFSKFTEHYEEVKFSWFVGGINCK